MAWQREQPENGLALFYEGLRQTKWEVGQQGMGGSGGHVAAAVAAVAGSEWSLLKVPGAPQRGTKAL